jgi:5-methylcytosine-specific restriction protein A
VKRVYNRRQWRDKLQPLKLQQQPFCESCKRAGRLRPSTVVHHIHTVSKGGAAFPRLDQLQALCAQCHNSITQAERTGREHVVKGAGADGLPIDPQHPFYGGAPPTRR